MEWRRTWIAASVPAVEESEESGCSSEDARAGDVPRKAKTLPVSPIMNDRPVVCHPPSFRKTVNTLAASPWGAMYTRGIKTAKKPRTWIIRIKHSSLGSRLEMIVLTITATKMTDHRRRVPCHRCGLYSGWVSAIRPWMSVPQRKAPDAVKACQPATVRKPI